MVRLLQTLLVGALTCGVTPAQIREEKPTPGIDEGMILHQPDRLPHSDLMISRHELSGSENSDVGSHDFTVCFWVPARDGSLAIGSLEKRAGGKGWSLLTGDGVTLRLDAPGTGSGITMKTPFVTSKGALGKAADNFHHVAVVIRREARQPLSGIWVDGAERTSVAVPPVDFSCPGTSVVFSDYHGDARFKDLRIYNRALTRPEILELTLRGKEGTAADKPKPKHPAPPANGPRFIPQPDETIALIGGTEAVALAESGELEALLLMAFPDTRFHFRSLAWEGDTVFKQDRPMNFGSLEQQLRRVNAGAVFVMFGRQECLDAGKGISEKGKGERDEAGLAEFKAAFGKLLDTVAKVTPNIVVIGPELFDIHNSPPSRNLIPINEVLSGYAKGMQERAEASGALFLDCQNVIDGAPSPTTDGVTYTSQGLRGLTVILGDRLGIGGAKALGLEFPQTSSKLLSIKNRLWHDYWRPSNWAFLHGDRTNQPSSRDPVNPQVRLFPSEQEKYLPLIKEAEEKIYQLVQEAQKKLP